MTSKRLYWLLLGVIGLLFVGLIAGAYGINSLLTQEADKMVALKAKDKALQQEQIDLSKAKKSIKKYADLEKIAKTIVPEDKSQAEAVREIVNIAAANDVHLASITFPASTLGGTATGTAAPPAPTAVASPAAGAKQSLSQLQPVKNIPGVYQLILTVTSDTNQPVLYSKFINFLQDLEHNRRTAQVSSITLQPVTTNRNLMTFNLTLNEYIKP